MYIPRLHQFPKEAEGPGKGPGATTITEQPQSPSITPAPGGVHRAGAAHRDLSPCHVGFAPYETVAGWSMAQDQRHMVLALKKLTAQASFTLTFSVRWEGGRTTSFPVALVPAPTRSHSHITFLRSTKNWTEGLPHPGLLPNPKSCQNGTFG